MGLKADAGKELLLLERSFCSEQRGRTTLTVGMLVLDYIFMRCWASDSPPHSTIERNTIVHEEVEAGLMIVDERGKRKRKIELCGSVTLSNRIPLLLSSPRGDEATIGCHTPSSYNPLTS